MELKEFNYFKRFLPEDDEDMQDTPDAGDNLGDAPDAGDDPEFDLGDENDAVDTEEDPEFDLDGGDVEPEEPADDTVEVDITSLVQKQQDLVNSLNSLIGSLKDNTESTNSNFATITSAIKAQDKKLEDAMREVESKMETEFRKRIPTPNESILLQTVSGFPYNQKLTDYWKPSENREYENTIANAKGGGNLYAKVYKQAQIEDEDPEKEKDYVLTSDDVNNSYNRSAIERSF